MNDIISTFNDLYYKIQISHNICLADVRNICYHAGNMLLEMSKEETKYLLIEKLKNMIHSFLDYKTSLNIESDTNALKWLYGTVECEDLPIATEFFRSCYSEIVKMILEDERAVIESNCVGDFLMKCYQKFSECKGIFLFGVD